MRKILLLTAYYYPEQISSTHLDEDLCEAYNNAEIRRVIYTPSPCRGVSREVREKYKNKKKEERFGGLEVIHRFNMFNERRNPLQRAIRYVICSFFYFFKGSFARDACSCDIIIVSSTPPIMGGVAALVKKIRRIPFVYLLQDIFPDSLVGTGLVTKNSLLWKIGRAIENFTYRNADKIIVISQDFKSNIMAKGVPEEKIEIVYNWVDTDRIKPISKDDNPLYEEFEISKEDFNVVYAGNLGNAQNVMLLIDAAQMLVSEKTIKFIIFGTGGMEQDLKNAALAKGLKNIKILPLQPLERVPYVYGVGNICVVACKEGLGGSAMPSKTWTIMSCGKAVLANFDDGELKRIVEDNECGIFTKAGDVDGFVKAIIKLRNNAEKCNMMGRNGRKYLLENLHKDICTQKYVNVIKSFEI